MTNWPLLISKLCDAHHCLPADLENQTLDQLYLLCIPDKQLLPEVTARPAPALPGFKTDNKKFDGVPGRSLVERVRNDKKVAEPTKDAKRKRDRKRGDK